MNPRAFLLPATPVATTMREWPAGIVQYAGSAIPPRPMLRIRDRTRNAVDNRARSVTFVRCEASFWSVDRKVFGPVGDTMTTAALRRMANILGVWSGRFDG